MLALYAAEATPLSSSRVLQLTKQMQTKLERAPPLKAQELCGLLLQPWHPASPRMMVLLLQPWHPAGPPKAVIGC